MTRNRLTSKLLALTLIALTGSSAAMAQSYYDDDIYYDPSKVKKEQPKQNKRTNRQQPSSQTSSGQYYYDGAAYVPWDNVGDYQAAGTYQATGSSTRDVDEYNRHTPASAEKPDSITLQEFEEMSSGMQNTRNLARFHDSDAARESMYQNGESYVSSDYNQGYQQGYNDGSQNSTSLNINVGGGWGWPYYSSWSWPYYSSWGWPYYSSWGWNNWYGPSWSWGWGPSWSWGWGGGWYPRRYYNDAPGAIRPNRPINNHYYGSATGGYNGSYNGRPYRGSISDSNGRRPGYSNGSSATQTSRPGYSAPIGRPTVSGNANLGTYQRGRGGYQQQATPSRTQNNNYRPQNTQSNSSWNNNNSGSWNRGRSSSSGSWGGSSGGFGGGRSSGGFGGGGGHTGGGTHRGR